MKKMTKRSFSALLSIVAAVVMVSIPAFAHHGTNISYDHAHPITFKATMTEFRFSNPHAQIFFDVVDEKGNVAHWNGELTNPSNLARNGWTRKRSESELKPGMPLTITVFPSKGGTDTAGPRRTYRVGVQHAKSLHDRNRDRLDSADIVVAGPRSECSAAGSSGRLGQSSLGSP